MRISTPLNRRAFIGALAATGAAAALPLSAARAEGTTLISRPIASTAEQLPLVGLGSWITFNVGNDPAARDSCAEVMHAFFDAGGRMIDSSPMYGSSQSVIGDGIKKAGTPPALFAATKVWTSSGADGPTQIEESRRLWGIARFDLLMVHNLLNWEEHLPTLLAMKAEGRVRYVGVTTSHGRRHDELEQIMQTQPLDFIQVTYNIADREVESRILPLAAEKRMGVILNRPLRGGELTQSLQGKPLPGFAAEIGCTSWAQILLKFIVSHPAVSCAIPATTRVDHVRENLLASSGPMPDEAMRARMLAHFESV